MEVSSRIACHAFPVVVVALVLVTRLAQCQLLACGFPGAPANGSVSPPGSTAFTVNASVTYSCSSSFILFGEEKRICRRNGTWSNEIPLCDSNVARDKYATQSGQFRQQKAGLAVDADTKTCSATPKTPSERWWQLSLGRSYQVTTVAVTIGVGVWHKFSIYVVSAEGDNRIVYNLCGSFEGEFEFSMVEIKCGNTTGQLGEYVFIRDNRPGTFQFNLCEVEVFAYRDDRPCGEPEVPLHGTVKRINESASEYGCQAGFVLHGPSVFRCVESLWESPPPTCKELHCQAPPPIRGSRFVPIYAEWFPSSDRSHYPFGTVLNYTCEWDFVTDMVGALVCSENAEWVGTHPICLPTDCGPPPIVPYATFRFLNTSSPTKTDSMVELLCHDGFYLTEGNAISRCLRGGNWSAINTTCRALVTENQTGDALEPALAVILTIVIILVVALFIVLVIMYVRRSEYLKRSIPMLARSSTEGADCPHQPPRGIPAMALASAVTNKLPPSDQDLYDDVWPSDEALNGDTLYTDAVSSTEDLTYDGSMDRIYDHPEGGCIEEAGEEPEVKHEDDNGESDGDQDHVYYSPLEGVEEQSDAILRIMTSDRSQLPPADGAPEPSSVEAKDGEDSEHIYEPLRRSSSPTFPLKPVYAKVDLALKKLRRHRDDSAGSASSDDEDVVTSSPTAAAGQENVQSRPQPEGIGTYTLPLFAAIPNSGGGSSGPGTPTSPTSSIGPASLQRPLPPIPPTATAGDSASLSSAVMVDNSLYGQRNSWGLVAENDLYDGTAVHAHRSPTGTTC